MPEFVVPTIRCGSQDVQHNNVRWRVCTNRHTTTAGRAWGWIEGAPGDVCWSNDNESFNEAAAGRAAHEHNEWLEQQKSVTVKLIEAEDVRKSAQARYDKAIRECDEAGVSLAKAEETVRNLIQERDAS